jgi:mannitol/fructose-specific phosphotransferase system IIA component (Ntr-type)
MKLLGFLNPEAIITDLEGVTKEEAIRRLVDVVVSAGEIAEGDREAVVAQVLAREEKGSTGLGGGVALPHVKGTEIVKGLCGAFARSESGVDFDAVDGRPVHILFLILSSKKQVDEHIAILKKISGIRENEHYLSSFRRAEDRDALVQLISGLGSGA